MFSFLRQPRWIILGVVSLVLGVLFVTLGLWQLRRLGEVRANNAQTTARLAATVEPIEVAVPLDTDLTVAGESYAFMPVSLTGTFDPSEEVLIRSQTNNGIAGFHVITPFVLSDGAAVLVNRGWVPLEMDTPPVAPSPPSGEQNLTVVLQPNQPRGRFGPVDPDGDVPRFSRIDIARFAQQMPYDLYPVYGLAGTTGGSLPVPVELPALDNGPHLAYAIQWFAFAVIAVGGFAILVRRQTQSQGAGGSRPPVDVA